MRTVVKAGVIAAGIAAAAATGTGIATAGGAADDSATEVAITGDALDRASTAALESTGGGRVTGTEVGDEESFYEVEVTLDNGDEVDVQLDETFAVVGSETDSGTDD